MSPQNYGCTATVTGWRRSSPHHLPGSFVAPEAAHTHPGSLQLSNTGCLLHKDAEGLGVELEEAALDLLVA